MMYAMHLAFRRLQESKKQYLAILLQVALGTCLLFIALSVQFSFISQQRAQSASVASAFVTVSGVYGSGTENVSPVPLSRLDYEALHNLPEREGAQTALYVRKGFTLRAGSGDILTTAYFTLGAFGPLCLDMPWDAQTPMAGRAVLQALDTDAHRFLRAEGVYAELADTLCGVPLANVTPLSDQAQKKQLPSSIGTFRSDGEAYLFSHAILLPFSAYEAYAEAINAGGALIVSIDPETPGKTETYCNAILHYLAFQYPDASFQYSNELERVLLAATGGLETARLLRDISLLLFAILFPGMLGLLLLLVNKRKRAFAIALMCGATVRRLALELWAEILLLMGLGGSLGLLVALPFFPVLAHSLSSYQVAYPSFSAAALCMLFCAGLTGGAVLAAVFKMRRVASPVSLKRA